MIDLDDRKRRLNEVDSSDAALLPASALESISSRGGRLTETGSSDEVALFSVSTLVTLSMGGSDNEARFWLHNFLDFGQTYLLHLPAH